MFFSRGGIVALVAFVWLFSTVDFQMCFQIACLWRRIITLVAFVWLFSTVSFQMCPQSAGIWGCIVTLVAFVRLFSTVCFQMCPQMACLRGFIVAPVAFVWLFSTVCFLMLCFNIGLKIHIFVNFRDHQTVGSHFWQLLLFYSRIIGQTGQVASFLYQN